MSGSRRDCFDWPLRPSLGASCAPASTGTARPAGAAVPGGEGLASLLTLAALMLVPVALVYVAGLLIEAMTRAPITFVIIGAGLVFGGAIACALTAPRPFHVEDDDIVILSPLFDMRLKR